MEAEQSDSNQKKTGYNKKMFLVILVSVIVLGLICGALLFLNIMETLNTRDTNNQNDCKETKANLITSPNLLRGGDDNDRVSRNRREHLKEVNGKFSGPKLEIRFENISYSSLLMTLV